MISLRAIFLPSHFLREVYEGRLTDYHKKQGQYNSEYSVMDENE